MTEILRAFWKEKRPERIAVLVSGILGMIIRGGNPVHGGQINSYLDHRIAMAFSIAALAAEGNTEIQDGQCVDVSYPSFFTELHSLSL